MIKRQLKIAQFDKIEQIYDEQKRIKGEFKIIQEGFERTVGRHELEETAKNFDNFVKLEELKEIEKDIAHLVRQDQLNVTNVRLNNIETKSKSFLSQEDFM